MPSGARLLQLLRPYSFLFAVAIFATVVASVLDGFTVALLIPFLRTLFGQQALAPTGGSAVQAVPARVTGTLITAGGPPGALPHAGVAVFGAVASQNPAANPPTPRRLAFLQSLCPAPRAPPFRHPHAP